MVVLLGHRSGMMRADPVVHSFKHLVLCLEVIGSDPHPKRVRFKQEMSSGLISLSLFKVESKILPVSWQDRSTACGCLGKYET